MTDWSREVGRSLVRGLGYRVARGIPWPIAVAVLLLIWLLGGDFR